MTVLRDTVVEERSPHPLDEVTQLLLSVLAAQSDGLGVLQACMRCAEGDSELHALLANMYRQQATWVQHLEPQVRKRLHPFSPSSPVEPW